MTNEEREEAIKELKALEKQSCEDEYIKVPKKALKYRTAGMVVYNTEWLKNHFDIERAIICGEQETYKNIPFLLHKESGCPLDECVKAYEKANEYLRSKSKLKG